ncbi:major facilitator superfamily domain-containing protein, partial [Coniochaeta sp. 2T2.1]
MTSWRHAFSLPKHAVADATPQGTVKFIAESIAGVHDTLKWPRPSADPADPLNWSVWRKTAILILSSIYAFVANYSSSNIAPALQLWNYTFPTDPRPYPELVRLIAVNVLFLGASSIWWVPLSNKFGRRPVLLVATLVLTLSTVWCGLAKSYGSLMAARIFQGIGGGAADTVSPALIGDIYFLDQRGRAMASFPYVLYSGIQLSRIAGGYIGFQLGWAYNFWVGTALAGFCFLGTALLVPETLYTRIQPTEDTNRDGIASDDSCEKTEAQATEIERQPIQDYPPYTINRALGFSPIREGFMQHLRQPWTTLALPGTWVVMLHYSGLVGGVVTISTIGAQLVAMPPYLWGANAGLISIGALIGTIFGALYTYLLSDSRLRKNARATTHGLAEPEGRLPTMFLPLAISTTGFFVFGFCAQYPGHNRWVGLEVGYGMVTFGLMQVPSVGFNYLMDSYGHLAADCFVMVTIMRSIIAFAWTFFVAEWVEQKGPAEAFGVFGMLMGIFSLLTVPLWLYGKRMRIARGPEV